MQQGVRTATKRDSRYTKPLGYTWRDLRLHLEAQFTPEMNWDNWGSYWHVDHIRPLHLFKYLDLDDPLYAEAWALSNLRPLPAAENLSKGGKWQEAEAA